MTVDSTDQGCIIVWSLRTESCLGNCFAAFCGLPSFGCFQSGDYDSLSFPLGSPLLLFPFASNFLFFWIRGWFRLDPPRRAPPRRMSRLLAVLWLLGQLTVLTAANEPQQRRREQWALGRNKQLISLPSCHLSAPPRPPPPLRKPHG